MLPRFAHARPETLQDATKIIDFDSPPYAGGTELLPVMKLGFMQPRRLVDLKRIPDLRKIEVRNNELVIGATATHYEIARHALVLEHVPILAEVEQQVGNIRVRTTGSIAGNICFAEPKSDVTTILVALDASLTLESTIGERQVSINAFLLGPYTTTREDNEIVTHIHIPLMESRRAIYLKYQTMERPTASVALVDEGETRRTLVVGAVGGRPERFDFARTDAIDPDQIASQIEVIPDLTGSEPYKRHIVALHIEKALAEISEARNG